MPIWLSDLIVKLGVALLQAAFNDAKNNIDKAKEMAERERLDGIRNGINAKKYVEAKTRAEQIIAATNLINRNDGV